MKWDHTDEHPWSPKSIKKYANQWNWAMRERKNFLYKHPIKLQVAADIINFLNIPTITFAETTEFADELVKMLDGKALAYHSNLKTGYSYEEVTEYRKQLIATKNLARKFNGKIGNYEKGNGYPVVYNKKVKIVASKLRKLALSKFEAGEIRTLCTAKALDEGFNVENIECAIICSASSKRRQMIQRINNTCPL
jgi:superfamily II DNA or RNA helicase